MMEEFIKFTHELFPSISPYTEDQVKKALLKFEQSDKKFNCFTPTTFEYLAQGDIIDSLPFRVYDKDGNEYTLVAKALLLSNTCHSENHEILSFVPLLPIEGYNLDKNILLKNITYSLLYFPDPIFKDFVVDFTIVNSFHKEFVIKFLESNKIKKVATLNRFGYYLFLTKLTIHFMRPENPGVQSEREILTSYSY